MAARLRPSPIVQRCGGHSCPSGGCSNEEPELARYAEPASAAPGFAPAVVEQALTSPSAGLPAPLRTTMQERFGHDFAHVRVHSNHVAERAATAVGARAFTVGRHIVMGSRQWAPGTQDGEHLLAHELAHVVQQHGAPDVVATQRLRMSAPQDASEVEAERVATATANGTLSRHEPGPIRVSATSPVLQRLGANPGCTPAEAADVHQGVFDARGWIDKARQRLAATPLGTDVQRSLRRNFGPTYGVAANAALITGRLGVARRELSTIPIGCAGVADATCAARHCGFSDAGSHAATICSNVTLVAGVDAVARAGCVLHESFHAAFSGFTVDEYSGWHGHSSSTAAYPGAGRDPLLNADSYTTLVMDLS